MNDSTTSGDSVGVVVSVQGEAFAVSEGESRELSIGSEIFESEKIITKEGGQVEIKFQDNTILSQGENSEVGIDAYIYDPENGSNSNLLLQMTQGVFRTMTGEIANQNPDHFNIQSPMGFIGIRGTTVVGHVSEEGEQWGVEDISDGHVLVVKDQFGNIQFISEPGMIIDFLQGEPINPARPLTPEELDFFIQTAPITSLDIQTGMGGTSKTENDTNNDTYSDDRNNEHSADEDDGGDSDVVVGVNDLDVGGVVVNESTEGDREPFGDEAYQNPLNGDNSNFPLIPPPQPEFQILGLIDYTDPDVPDFYSAGNEGDDLFGSEETWETEDTFAQANARDTAPVPPETTSTYTPDPNFNGQASFDYLVSDGNGGTDTATVTIDVTPISNPPVFTGDETGAVTEDVDPDSNTLLETSGTLTATDPDAGESGFIAGPAAPVGQTLGNLNIIANGDWTYTADNTQTAIQELGATDTLTDTFSVTSIDGTSHDIIITINGTNDAPVADVPDLFSIDEETILTGTLTATDADGDDLTFSLIDVQGYTGIPIQLTNFASDSYEPQINNNGDVVWYTYDGNDYEIYLYDGTTSMRTRLTGNEHNDFSAQINDNGDVVWTGYDGSDYEIYLYDGTTSITTRLTDNDYDDYLPLINNNGDVVWRVDDGNDYEIYLYDGTTSITTQLTDNDYVDGNPKINNNGDVVWRGYDGTGYKIYLYDSETSETTQLTNNSYYDRNPQINNNGDVVWQSNDGTNEAIYFYNGTTSNTTQLTNNDDIYEDPMLNDNGDVVWNTYDGNDYEIYLYDGTTSITTRLTDNDYDDYLPLINNNGDVVWSRYGGLVETIYYLKSDTISEGIIINPDGTFSYTPDPNSNGQVSFDYLVSDGNGGTDINTVTIDIAPLNDAPVADHFYNETDEDIVLNGIVSGFDIEGDNLTYTVDTNPANGSLTLNSDGTYQYTPDTDFNGTDSFSYTASDSDAISDPAMVDILVNSINDVPVPGPDTFITSEDTTLYGTLSAADVDGDNLTFSSVEAAATVIQLTNNTSTDQLPQVNNNGHVVWGSNGAINLWNGTTTTQLTDNSYANMDPQINDYGHVVWVGDDSYGSDSEIYLYDGTNTIQLTDDGYDDHSPMINNNGDVVWSSHDGTDYELILYDGTNTTSLGNINYNSKPQINDNGDVVWYDYDGTDYEIYFYDGTTSITTPLTNNSYNDRAPQINNNGDVVWNSNGQINLWNGTTTTQLSDFVGALTSVHINDHGHVVWASNGEINLWNGTTTIQLTNNGNSNYNPMISESGYVVWQGGIGSDYEIYFYDGATTIQLTDNNFHDGNQQISDNGHVVWQSGGASHYDIYYFQPYNPHGDVTINTDGTFTYSPDSGFYGQAGFGYMVDDGNGGTDTAIVTLDVANVAGTTGDDILYGTNLNDTMDGFAGNDEIYGYEGNDVLIGGSGDDTFLFTDSSSVDTVRDFTAQGSGIGNENDVLKFIESNVEGDTEWLEFNAQGNNTDNYISANSTNPADSTAYKIIGVTDTVVDWSNSSVLSVLNNAVDTTAANENDDGTYLIASNGTNSRVYFWEGDTNPESGDINDKIDESELTYFVDLEDFNSTDIDNLDELNFQIV